MYRSFQLFMAAALCCYPILLCADGMPACYRELQTTFFQENLVAEALNLYRVNKTLWRPIYTDLQRASSQVPQILQARAKSQQTNPLSPVFIPEKAFQLLQDTLESVYTDVLMNYRSLNSSINSTTAKGGFGYIWDKQFRRLQLCVEAQKATSEK